MFEWRVNLIAGNFDKDYVSNHLQEVSGILSHNDNLIVNIIQDKTASYIIDMTGINTGEVKYVDGKIF